MNRQVVRGRTVLLVEEPSMKAFLEGVLPRVVPRGRFLILVHQGKQDLRKSIPRKLRGWTEGGARFVILHDRDHADCLHLKTELRALCEQAGRSDAVVRIVCPHLESWVLGDLTAVGEAFAQPRLAQLGNHAKYRDPDALGNASEVLRKLVPEYQKVSGARVVGALAEPERNRSRSFRVFLDSVRALSTVNPR